jgi:hypothetical protein
MQCIEQAGDGSWTAAIIGENTVLGTDDTRDEALDDLRKSLVVLIGYLKESPCLSPQSRLCVSR